MIGDWGGLSAFGPQGQDGSILLDVKDIAIEEKQGNEGGALIQFALLFA